MTRSLLPNNRDTKKLVNGQPTIVTSGSGSILSGIIYDEIQAAYPTSTTEVYTYFLTSNQVAEITVTYTNSSKRNIQSVVLV